MTKKRWLDNLIFVVAFAAAFVLLWTIAALAVGNPFVLPNVSDVCRELSLLLTSVTFYASAGLTVLRALTAFALSLAVALALALCANLYPVKRPLSAVVTLLRALPTMSIIFLCIVVFPSRAISYIVTFLVAFPVMYAAFDGTLVEQKPLADMCKVFGVRRIDKVRFVYLPSLAPQVLLQCRSTVALAVKVCIAGEALALPARGMGVEMYVAKVNLDTANLLAWTIVALVCCYVLDGLFALVGNAIKKVRAKADKAVAVAETGENVGFAVGNKTVQSSDLTLSDITVKFGDNTVYDNFAATFKQGKVHVVLGASGCGKTTLLNVVAGLVSHGGAVSGANKCAYVFQEARLAPCNVSDNVALVLKKDIPDKTLRNQMCNAALTAVGMADKSRRNPSTLSGGEAQRVALARAFVTDVDVLLADEPMKSLDLSVKRGLYHTLDELLQQKPLTVLYVTHDVEEAVMLADEVYFAGAPDGLSRACTIDVPRAERSPWSQQSVKLKMMLEDKLLQDSSVAID